MNHQNISSFIWKVADDVLRGLFKPHEYGDVILPFVVLRRLGCVLEPKKDQVYDRHFSLLFRQFHVKEYNQLTLTPRDEISALKKARHTQQRIAEIVGVNPSAILRELRLNKSSKRKHE